MRVLAFASMSVALALASPAFAQKAGGPAYDWTPEQFTTEQYFMHMVVEVGDALTTDMPASNQCDTLMYARVDATAGSQRLVNAAIWTAFVVRAGNLRTAGAEVTPEMDQQIRIPITPNGLRSPVALAFFDRMRATPGGIEARTAECVDAFNAAAGPSRRYFEQRADYLSRNR